MVCYGNLQEKSCSFARFLLSCVCFKLERNSQWWKFNSLAVFRVQQRFLAKSKGHLFFSLCYSEFISFSFVSLFLFHSSSLRLLFVIPNKIKLTFLYLSTDSLQCLTWFWITLYSVVHCFNYPYYMKNRNATKDESRHGGVRKTLNVTLDKLFL